jgi:hypothetical protein
MSLTASAAGAATSLRFKPSPLARAIRIAPTKKKRQADIDRDAKRVGVVLRKGMRQTEFRRIDMRMSQHDLATAPIVIGGKNSALTDTALCGLIVTGSDAICHPAEVEQLAGLIRAARERTVVVVALSNAAPIALAAMGLQPTEGNFGVLIDGATATALTTQRDADRAIDLLARSPAA